MLTESSRIFLPPGLGARMPERHSWKTQVSTQSVSSWPQGNSVVPAITRFRGRRRPGEVWGEGSGLTSCQAPTLPSGSL